MLEKEIWDAGKKTNTAHAVVFGFIQQCLQQHAARALALGFREHHNRAHLRQVGTVKVQCTAALKDALSRFRDGKVAHVLANLREGAPQQGAILRQAVHQLVNVGRVLQPGLTYFHHLSHRGRKSFLLRS